MNTYLINFQYQGDDRCENHYRAYCKTDDENEVVDKICDLDITPDLELQCKYDFREYFEYNEEFDEDEDWVGIEAINVSNENYIDSDWFNNLTCLIDER